MSIALPVELKPADFTSDQDVRWCPGCGDYAILAQAKKVLARVTDDRSKIAFISGIGCASRFPYYVDTYGFHSIHGRAPTVATGLKLARPDLTVWVVTGDGDGLSIGGNHLLHMIRRNLNVKILLFNNRVYGLTKGQYSPTSEKGMKTKTSPMGSLETPVRPLSFALGVGATFAARANAMDMKHLEYILERAAKHKGAAFVEIYQNCIIFNDGVFAYATDKESKAEATVYLEHGNPLIFGKDRNKGIRLNGLKPEIVTVTDETRSGLLHHDEQNCGTLGFLLSTLTQPDFPEPFGVLRAVEEDCLDDLVHEQIASARAAKGGKADLQTLLNGAETWTVQ